MSWKRPFDGLDLDKLGATKEEVDALRRARRHPSKRPPHEVVQELSDALPEAAHSRPRPTFEGCAEFEL